MCIKHACPEFLFFFFFLNLFINSSLISPFVNWSLKAEAKILSAQSSLLNNINVHKYIIILLFWTHKQLEIHVTDPNLTRSICAVRSIVRYVDFLYETFELGWYDLDNLGLNQSL